MIPQYTSKKKEQGVVKNQSSPVNRQSRRTKKETTQKQGSRGHEQEDQRSQQCGSDESVLAFGIKEFSECFQGHLPVIFACYNKLKKDLEENVEQLSFRLRNLMLNQKVCHRLFITSDITSGNYDYVATQLRRLGLEWGSYLVFESNFNDIGGIVFQELKGCFVLRANMARDTQYQDGYCRFAALEVFEILFEPTSLQKMDVVVFDDNKELIRAAKWKGYKTFYLTADDKLCDGLGKFVSLSSQQDYLYSTSDLMPISDNIFAQREKVKSNSLSSIWKLKDLRGRSWLATADIAGSLIEPEQISQASQFVKVVNKMYKSMSVSISQCQLVSLPHSSNSQSNKKNADLKLLHYMIDQDPKKVLIESLSSIQQILQTGTVTMEGEELDIQGLGSILVLANIFSCNSQIGAVFKSIYVSRSEKMSGAIEAELRNYKVSFNGLKEINQKTEYFFDDQSRAKFTLMEIDGIEFANMHPSIKNQVLKGISSMAHFLCTQQHLQIFQLLTDKQLKNCDIRRKDTEKELKKRIEMLISCYKIKTDDQPCNQQQMIEIQTDPGMTIQQLASLALQERLLVITGEFDNDINMLCDYLEKQLKSSVKHQKSIDCRGMEDEVFFNKLEGCNNKTSSSIFIRNYHSRKFGDKPILADSVLNGSKGEEGPIVVVGIAQRFLPLRESQIFRSSNVTEISCTKIKGTKFTNDPEVSRFAEEKLEILESVAQNYFKFHAKELMNLITSNYQLREFLRVPSMLNHLISVSHILSRRKSIYINILFEVMHEEWIKYVKDVHGQNTCSKFQEQVFLITMDYFTDPGSVAVNQKSDMYRYILRVSDKEKTNKKSQYDTISFLANTGESLTFKHEMYAAYLVSLNVLQELDNKEAVVNCIRALLSNSMVRLFLIEKIRKQNLEAKLMEIVKDSKYRHFNKGSAAKSGIAASLLTLVYPNLSNNDFSFCEFPKATFQGCNLTKTDFSYANLLDCYFGRANCFETLIYRCRHMGSVQFQQVQEYEFNRKVKQIEFCERKAYVLVGSLLEVWEFNLGKMIQVLSDSGLISTIKITGKLLICYTTQNSLQIRNVDTMELVVKFKSYLKILHDMIVTPEMAILTCNTNCIEQWLFGDYLKLVDSEPIEAKNQKLKDRFNNIVYSLRRVTSIVRGEEATMYIGDSDGTVFKYSMTSMNVVSSYKVAANEQEVLCLGFFQGKRTKKLLTFTSDLVFKVYLDKGSGFQQIWRNKEFQILKQIGANEKFVYGLSEHAVSVYGNRFVGRSTTKLNYYRNEALHFISLSEDTYENQLLIVHMKGINVIPFMSNDIYHQKFSHEHTITCLAQTQMPIIQGQMIQMLNVIISGSLDMKINFWNMESLAILASIDAECTISQIKIHDNFMICGTHHFYILVYSLDTLLLSRKLTGHEGSINCMTVQEGILYTASNDKYIFKWLIQGWELKEKYRLVEAATSIVTGLDYEECIVGTQFGRILWLDNGGSCRNELVDHKTAVEMIIIRGDDGYSCSSEKLLKWKVNSKQLVTSLEIPAATFTTISFYKQFILASVDQSLLFLDTNLKVLSTHLVHQYKIKAIVYDEAKGVIYSAGQGRCIKMFDVSKGHDQLSFVMSMPQRLVLSKVEYN